MNNTMGVVIPPSLRKLATMASTLLESVPAAKARRHDSCKMGPLATGSEKGTPNSMMSAPRWASSVMRAAVASRLGHGNDKVMRLVV